MPLTTDEFRRPYRIPLFYHQDRLDVCRMCIPIIFLESHLSRDCEESQVNDCTCMMNNNVHDIFYNFLTQKKQKISQNVLFNIPPWWFYRIDSIKMAVFYSAEPRLIRLGQELSIRISKKRIQLTRYQYCREPTPTSTRPHLYFLWQKVALNPRLNLSIPTQN